MNNSFVFIFSVFILVACGGSGDGSGSSDDINPGDPTPPPIEVTDANYGLQGRLYSDNGEFLDLATGKVYVIAPQFDDSTTYPSRDGSEFVEVIQNYRFIWDDDECFGFAIWKDLVAIRDAQTGLINDSFEIYERAYGEARLSHDNQYVALTWDDNKGCPSNTSSQLSVFNRQGELQFKAIESITDYDWLPDNRLVITDGQSIKVAESPLSLSVISYPFPVSVIGDEAYIGNIKASPTGDRVLFEVVTDASSWLSSVTFRYATVWEFDLDTQQFREYITSRREGENPQLNRPIWSPDGSQVIVTEDYTGGILSSITPGDILTGWDGWRDLIIVPLEVSGVNYVFDASESSMVLPPAADSSSRPIFSYENGREQFFRLSPFYEQAWVTSPDEITPSAGSLPIDNTAINLGLTGSLYFAGEDDNDNFVVHEQDLATNSIAELFQISNDATDRYTDTIYPSEDGELFAYYDYRDLEDKVILIYDRVGNLQSQLQLYNGSTFDASPYSRIMLSPDNTKVAFAYEDQNHSEELQRVIVFDWRDGSNARIFNEQEFDNSEWMPNGDLLLFAESEVYLSSNNNRVMGDPQFLFSLNGNTPRHPDVSPSGEKIAFVLGHHIWVANIDGTQLRQLTTLSDSFERYPAWSPDGEYLIFQRHDEDHSFGDYWVIAADAESIPVWDDFNVPHAHKITHDGLRSNRYGPSYWK